MKKKLCTFLAMMVLISIVAPVIATAANRPSAQEMENGLRNAIPIDCDIRIATKGQSSYIVIDYDCSGLSDETVNEFGKVIYYAKQYYEKNCGEYYVKIYLNDQELGKCQMEWEASFFGRSIITDSRKSWPDDDTTIWEEEELFDYFPDLEESIKNPESQKSSSSKATNVQAPTTEQDEEDKPGKSYIVNKGTHKYHIINCPYAPKPESKNYSIETTTPESLKSRGYKPCQKCLKSYG